MDTVREKLKQQLEERGFDVANDTFASRGELYVNGQGDLAAALFEFKSDVHDAMETMYQGHWSEGLPPRFAVLPTAAATDPMFEVLEQMHIIPLLYDTDGFCNLDKLVATHLRRG